MDAVLIAVITGLASFVGNWAANKVHLQYLRRDIDLAHRRIDHMQGIKN